MRPTFVLLLLTLLAAPSLAMDLTTLDRSLRKEPVYQSKTPKYCLLVFGPEARTRIWLVLDGDRLFVDRNGNGDLTDDGEPVAALEGWKQFEEKVYGIGEIREGMLTHKNLSLQVSKIDRLASDDDVVKQWLAKHPGAKGCALSADIEMPGWKGDGAGGRGRQFAGWHDTNGVLAFADRPQEAPILHFRGPWQIALRGPTSLTIGRATELGLDVVTQGLGAGTTVSITYDGVIPENRHPHVEITYPPKLPGAKPVKQLYELKERC
jgi:hypothetical protein